MNRAAGFLLLPFFLIAAAPAWPAVVIHNLRHWQAPDNTRLVFDLSAPAEHRLYSESDPAQIVIEIDDAVLREPLPAIPADSTRIAALEARHEDDGRLRVSIALKKETRPRSFVLKPVGEYGHRLVIDLNDPDAVEAEAARPEPPVTSMPPSAKRVRVIAIDAGHGGEDPGALGRRYRTREKDVTLAMARELARQVNATPGLKAVLMRDGDYYVPLGRRFRKARDADADVFVSLHADSFPGRRQAKGSSVYALSERGASHVFAKALADHENYADLVGGVTLNDKEDDVRKLLLDLSLTKQIEHSLQLGTDILKELRGVGPVHVNRVAQAGFAVLKSPDVASVLIETAFISNPTEEKKLRTPAFQRNLAAGVLKGIKRFIARHGEEPVTIEASAGGNPENRAATVAPLGETSDARETPAPAREHVVRRGETFSSIARRYKVDVDVLRFFNDLAGQELVIGARIRIPPSEGG